LFVICCHNFIDLAGFETPKNYRR